MRHPGTCPASRTARISPLYDAARENYGQGPVACKAGHPDNVDVRGGCGTALSAPGHRHPADQDRTATHVRARVDVAADGLDRLEHRTQVACDRDRIDGMHDGAILDQE